MIFDIENWLWKSNFGTFWKLAINPKLKIQQFSLGMNWFLGKNLSNFIPPAWKLDNPYCHIAWVQKLQIAINYFNHPFDQVDNYFLRFTSWIWNRQNTIQNASVDSCSAWRSSNIRQRFKLKKRFYFFLLSLLIIPIFLIWMTYLDTSRRENSFNSLCTLFQVFDIVVIVGVWQPSEE